MWDGTDGTRRRKKAKGFDGEMELVAQAPSGPLHSTEGVCATRSYGAFLWHQNSEINLFFFVTAPFFESFRHTQTFANADGSATTHIFASCTLDDISKATALRAEDAAFALKECGLLQRRKKRDSEEHEDVICVSREMVEAVARARGIKKNMMELNHVLL